jgi:hopanoid C-2 methylase
MLTMNLLQALPKTALWDRLAREDRLTEDTSLESNVRFVRPYADVVAAWRRCIEYAYDPGRLYSRFSHQIDATYVNRLAAPARGRLTKANMKRGATLLWNLLLRLGISADYRAAFWRMAWKAIRRGQIEALFGVGFVSYHLIEFSREALRGDQNASFYSARSRKPGIAAEAAGRVRMGA